MPSVSNPNGPSKNRLAARASKSKHNRQKSGAQSRHKIAPRDVARGARPGLLPNSGPNKKLSGKAARKMEKKLRHAMKRREEEEGLVEMKDVPEGKGKEEKVEGGEKEGEMEIA